MRRLGLVLSLKRSVLESLAEGLEVEQMKKFVTMQPRVFECYLTTAVRVDRKLEACVTWGMLPGCLLLHRQRVVPKHLQTLSSARLKR